MNIRNKLGLTYLTVSFLALLFISIFLYSYVKEALTKEVLSHLESVSSIQKHRIEAIISRNLERIQLVSSRTQLRLSLDNYIHTKRREDFEKMRLILNDARSSIPSFDVISILDLQGKVLVSTDDAKINHNFSAHDFYPLAIKQNNAEHFFLDEQHELKLYMSGPLTIEDNLIGILLIESEATNIVSSLADYSGLRQTGETALGRKHSSGDSVEYLTPLRFDNTAALRRTVPMSNKENAMVKALSDPQQQLTSAIDYRGHEVLLATNYIPETQWGLVVKIDEVEAFESISTLVKYIVVITLVVMFVFVWVSFALSSIISKPIVELTRVAHGVNEGDLHQRADINSHDEVAELAETFNNMTNTLVQARYDLEKTNKELENHRDHLEEMVSQRTRELERSMQEMESFSYSVSHDLRSPLRAIDGYAHILQEDYGAQLDEDGKNSLQHMRQASQRMGILIDDMLELARINRKELDRKKVDLTAKAKSIITSLEHQSMRKVEFIIQPDLMVFGDDTLMDVVVSNLINNAWKYTGKCDTARIEFCAHSSDGELVYYVKDNGIGFDEKYADKVFGAFQRLVRQDEYPGTGIGLATVLRVIQRHGGRVWAKGEPGKGATFYFTVPPS